MPVAVHQLPITGHNNVSRVHHPHSRQPVHRTRTRWISTADHFSEAPDILPTIWTLLHTGSPAGSAIPDWGPLPWMKSVWGGYF